MPLKGTTFSGHPTRTTLGNTFRSLLYMYYYLERSGFKNPWLSKDCFVAAAGDDVVAWVPNKKAKKVQANILKLSTRSKDDTKPTGLGQ